MTDRTEKETFRDNYDVRKSHKTGTFIDDTDQVQGHIREGGLAHKDEFEQTCRANCVESVVERTTFEDLLQWAWLLKVDENHNQWLDDEWPDREDELRVKVGEVLDKLLWRKE